MLSYTTSCMAEPGSKLSVQVRSAKLRTEPRHWSKATMDLNYGDSVEEVEATGGWYKVRNDAGQVGFIHESALTTRRVVLRPDASQVGQSIDAADIVLAGKGFNSDVEADYSAANKDLDYGAVTAWEQVRIDDQRILAFLTEGGLKTEGVQNAK